ncbi:hypothetical protein SprV_0100481700 [Sparganum proliferum]
MSVFFLKFSIDGDILTFAGRASHGLTTRTIRPQLHLNRPKAGKSESSGLNSPKQSFAGFDDNYFAEAFEPSTAFFGIFNTSLTTGKRPRQPITATAAAGQSRPSRLFYISDKSSGLRFLVDTGAEISVIPPPRRHYFKPSQSSLQAANSTTINIYGQRSLTLDIGLRRRFQWVFVQTDVKSPIIGADFLTYFGLAVDLKHRKLIDTTTTLFIVRVAASEISVSIQLTVPSLPFADILNGYSFLTKSYHVRAYHQIPVEEEDVPKTAVTTPFGLFKFLRMPFGLRNAAHSFQRFIDEVLRGLSFTYVYIDDILVASSSAEEYASHLRHIFDRFQQHGLQLNVDRCIFGVSSLDFLGHQVDQHGITPLLEKVQSILSFPVPKTLTQLRRFIGLLNYCRRFVPHCAATPAPLTDLLKSKAKPVELSPERERESSDPHAQLILTTDASNSAVGAVLHQQENNHLQPLAFFSQNPQPAQTRYSTFSRELLAIYLAIRHFRHLLEGRDFSVHTDHKPLTYALKAKPDRYSPREVRHLDYISQFTADIRYVRGSDNIVADALSRPDINTLTSDFDLAKSADLQSGDKSIDDLVLLLLCNFEMHLFPHHQARFCATGPQALLDLLFHYPTARQYLIISIPCHILASALLVS